MDILSKYLSRITSSLSSCILLWKAKLPFPSENDPKRHRTGKAGLKTLVRSQEKSLPRVIHRCTAEPKPSSPPRRLSSLWSPSSPKFRISMIGDVIGTESGDCMVSEVVEVRAEGEPWKAKCRERSERKREFPPPITLLREKERMPWALKREYSGDGRLVITAERVRRHEYCMEARREDWRITMRFVSEEGDYCEECGYPMDEEFEFNEGFEGVVDNGEEEVGSEFEEELTKESWNERGRRGGLRECAAGPGGLFQLQHSDSFPNSFLGRPVSAPLRPMAHVM